jgi:hypothetical protein
MTWEEVTIVIGVVSLIVGGIVKIFSSNKKDIKKEGTPVCNRQNDIDEILTKLTTMDSELKVMQANYQHIEKEFDKHRDEVKTNFGRMFDKMDGLRDALNSR